MRVVLAALLVAMLGAGCAETVRCPDGQIFADDGTCVPIPDAGVEDASTDGG
jgi:hypothetical protein